MDRILIRNGSNIKEVTHLVGFYPDGDFEANIVDTTEIYLGSKMPFNHFYIHFNSANTTSSIANIEYWDGSQFKDVANYIDETSVSGVTFSKSGFISWTPDEDYKWRYEDTENIAELEITKYYDLYWNRISFSNSLDVGLVIKYIGQLFCTDNELYSEFYQFSETDWLDGFAEGKLDWTEQRVRATELITSELKGITTILTKDQILDRSDLRDATVQKTAEIIFNRFGLGRSEERDFAKLEASARLVNSFPKIDKNGDATYNRDEANKKTYWIR